MGGAYKVKKLAARDSHFLLNNFLIKNFGGPGGVFGGPGGGLGGPGGGFRTGRSSGKATAGTGVQGVFQSVCGVSERTAKQKTPGI